MKMHEQPTKINFISRCFTKCIFIRWKSEILARTESFRNVSVDFLSFNPRLLLKSRFPPKIHVMICRVRGVYRGALSTRIGENTWTIDANMRKSWKIIQKLNEGKQIKVFKRLRQTYALVFHCKHNKKSTFSQNQFFKQNSYWPVKSIWKRVADHDFHGPEPQK